MSKICINRVAVVTETGIIENGSVAFENGIITEVNHRSVAGGCDVAVDGAGLTAVPGYIDTHCHGGNGFDANDATAESVEEIAAFYLRHGVTTIYPTLAADDFDRLIECCDATRKAMCRNAPGKADIRGAHLEGPFLNTLYKGSQPEEYFIRFDDRHLEAIEAHRDVIKRITIAPETEGNMRRIAALRRLGIVVTGGHSDATYEQTIMAAEQGMTGVTHLYNAMSGVHKDGPFRVCGMTEAGLTTDALYAEIIADGYHVPVPLMQTAYRCKGPDKLLVCSDANSAAGKGDGTYRVYGHVFTVENGVAINAGRTSLAGSITAPDAMMRLLITRAGIPAVDAAKMLALTPARMMGIDRRKGSIAPGKVADINLLDREFRVMTTFAGGKDIRIPD